ncbi:hypothetical protein DN069_14735 [Streptacidiphilus pinicola]|uniref:Uncharacterized protein n=1 Tax=Streptacidiphilus pinicola TaxID=2219663 RepID=A0A2X0IJN0_9ACTN|nr:hypothetical protein [Streptacidiphilus pinicola]RAG84857.1 hypothetical protein DN069_14735 [Streptacidiphilus pinicola]
MPLAGGLLALARMDLRDREPGSVWTRGDRLLLALTPGAAEELPGLLLWLGWGHLAPVLRGRAGGGTGRLLRPGPSPGPEPLARLLDTCADACARVQIEATAQPWAFSYASRMLLGTRPRSLTS